MLTDKYTYKPYRKKHGAIQNCTFLKKMVVLANANLSTTMGVMGCCQNIAMGFLVFRMVAYWPKLYKPNDILVARYFFKVSLD